MFPAKESAYVREGLKRLGYSSLADYEASDRWKARRERYYSDNPSRYKCVICSERHNLQLNHRTYQNIGNERDADLDWRCDLHHVAWHLAWQKQALAERKRGPNKRGGLLWRILFGA